MNDAVNSTFDNSPKPTDTFKITPVRKHEPFFSKTTKKNVTRNNPKLNPNDGNSPGEVLSYLKEGKFADSDRDFFKDDIFMSPRYSLNICKVAPPP